MKPRKHRVFNKSNAGDAEMKKANVECGINLEAKQFCILHMRNACKIFIIYAMVYYLKL